MVRRICSMVQTDKKNKRPRWVKPAAVAVIVVVAAVAIFAALTAPRDALNFPVAFSVGGDVVHENFQMPLLTGVVQVTVEIKQGAALWSASIVNSAGSEVFTHHMLQGDQTTYASEWITLPPGTYNFTFSTLGVGSLSALVTVRAKGGFW
jgi:hypothetical protein